MTKEETRKKFQTKLIPWGMSLLNRAEAMGVDWQKIPMSQLESAVIMAEEFATPDEYKSNPFSNYNQRMNHG